MVLRSTDRKHKSSSMKVCVLRMLTRPMGFRPRKVAKSVLGQEHTLPSKGYRAAEKVPAQTTASPYSLLIHVALHLLRPTHDRDARKPDAIAAINISCLKSVKCPVRCESSSNGRGTLDCKLSEDRRMSLFEAVFA